MHARLDRGRAQSLTRTGLDWTHKYPAKAAAVSALPARQAYLDGELCGVRHDGKTSFSMIQTASDAGIADALVFFLFDLLYLDGDAISAAPLRVRKERLRQLLSDTSRPPHFSDHQIGCGLEFYANVCEMSLEGIISKRADAPYSPGDRRLWVKVKCENREEFMVVGWTDPEGAPVVGLGRSCWRITIRLGGSFMQGASGRVLTMRSSAGLGVTCTPRHFRDAPSIKLSLGPTGLVHAGIEPCALGPSRAYSRGQVPDLDRRQPASSGGLPGFATRQKPARGAP
jgi:hypothetical protein